MIVLIVDFGKDVLSEAPLADWTLKLGRFVALGLLARYELIGRHKVVLSMLLLHSLREVPLSQIYDGLLVFIECNLTNLPSGALLNQFCHSSDHSRRSHRRSHLRIIWEDLWRSLHLS